MACTRAAGIGRHHQIPLDTSEEWAPRAVGSGHHRTKGTTDYQRALDTSNSGHQQAPNRHHCKVGSRQHRALGNPTRHWQHQAGSYRGHWAPLSTVHSYWVLSTGHHQEVGTRYQPSAGSVYHWPLPDTTGHHQGLEICTKHPWAPPDSRHQAPLVGNRHSWAPCTSTGYSALGTRLLWVAGGSRHHQTSGTIDHYRAPRGEDHHGFQVMRGVCRAGHPQNARCRGNLQIPEALGGPLWDPGSWTRWALASSSRSLSYVLTTGHHAPGSGHNWAAGTSGHQIGS